MNEGSVALLLGMACLLAGAAPAEVLYNGIVLPDEWPPPGRDLTREPLAEPPYLTAPPAVIPIDLGRQLFVDDFLIDSTDLRRTFHLARYHEANPVIRPDRPTDLGNGRRTGAGVFSDGVWYDPADGLFKCWYWGGSISTAPLGYSTCLATSRDGVTWTKPELDVVPGTNIVLPDEHLMRRNSSTVWLDLDEPDPARRYKMFRNCGRDISVENALRQEHRIRLSFSPDGVHWTLAGESDTCGDRTTVFYNPFRKVWVYGLRDGGKEVSRARAYRECSDPVAGLQWSAGPRPKTRGLWVAADRLDADRSDLNLRRVPERPWDLVPSQLYNLDAVGYESLMLGLFTIWRGHPNDGRPKINELCVGFSRDGYHWTRPDRRAFCPVSENPADWNWGNVQSAGGGCLIVGDQLHFYVTAANRPAGWATGLDATYTGLATLRRDGFASLDAGAEGGTLTTRPVRFAGRHLFVNLAAPTGELRVEVLDEQGQVVDAFRRDRCRPVTGDATRTEVRWSSGDLATLAGRPVRFRFHLRSGELYAFWVSPTQKGASEGFVAAGGPGFTAARDTT